jgi:hypothetical protein
MAHLVLEIRPMRALSLIGLGLALAVTASTGAAAQERKPLRVEVQKRSIFDAGPVVPVGSLNRYASQHFYTSPPWSFSGDRYGEGSLPARIGAGTNPFAFSFWGP